jgi:Bacterial membrane protein YfhO
MNRSSRLSILKGGPLACLFFLLVFALYFSPVFFSNRWLAPEDGRIESLPAFYANHALWTTDLCCGWPLSADPMIQSFNPLALLMPYLPAGWNLFMLAGYVLAATFMYLLAYEIVGSVLGALIAAVLYGLSGLLVLEANHVLIVHSAAYLPLLLLALEKQSKKTTVKWLTVGALAIGLGCLGGHIQVLLYSLFFGAVFVLYKLFLAQGKRRELTYQYFWIFALGIAIGAIQILPTLELSRLSIRQHFTYELFTGGAIHPLQLIGALFPYYLGSHDGTFFGIQYFGSFLQQPLMCYIGMMPLLLLPLSLLLWRKPGPLKFWFWTAILTLLLSLGSATPLAMIFYHIPPFGSMRCHYRVFFLTIVAAAICCAFVVKAIEDSEFDRETLGRAIIAEVGIFTAMLFCMSQISEVLGKQAAQFGNPHLGFLPWTNPALGMQVAVLMLTIGVFFLWTFRPKNPITSALLVCVLLADLSFQGWFCQWRAEVVPDTYLLAPAHAVTYRNLLSRSHQRMLPVRGASAGKDELPPCASRNWDVPSASGYSPIIMKRYQDLTTITEGGFLMPPWQFTGKDRTFDILAIRYMFTECGDQRLLKLIDNGVPLFKKVAGAGQADVFENQRAMPRCWMVNDALVLPPEQILKSIKNSKLPDGTDFAPDSVALVEEQFKEIEQNMHGANQGSGEQGSSEPTRTDATDATGKRGTAVMTALEPEHIEIKTESGRANVLILSDTFYPGWKATVDDKEVPIHCTDYVLRGVFVPAGSHIVSFVYRPLSLLVGALLCALAGIVLLVMSLRSYWSKRRTAV